MACNQQQAIQAKAVWPEEGARLMPDPLDAVEKLLRRYLVLPDPSYYPAMVLWIAHTYGFTRWDSTPRIAFMAPEKDSGKSRALELLEALCAHARIVSGRAGISLAGIRQFINGDQTPTVLVDEIDTVFGGGRSNEDLRGFINSGYRRKTGFVVRAGSKQEGPVFYSTFAPVAMAGLSAGSLPDTVTSRSLMIRRRRALPGETVDDFDEADETELQALASELELWVGSHIITGKLTAMVNMPSSVRNRARQIWKPLLQVAACAGGDWPERGLNACLGFVADAARRDRPSLGTQILMVTKGMFAEAGDAEFLPTEQIVSRLAEEETISQTVNNKRLGVELAEYDIIPTQRRWNGTVRRGYERHRFAEAWAAYIPHDKP